jgi:acid stress-induced BolA-like protein IbaG/YrbA
MQKMIEAMLQKALPAAMIIVDSNDNVHFNVIIVSERFIGLSKLQQQQLVYAALGDKMLTGEIHALSMKTYTPAAWEVLQQRSKP